MRICRNLQEGLSPRVDFPWRHDESLGGTTSRFQESRTRSRNPERLHEPPGRPRVPFWILHAPECDRGKAGWCRLGTRGWNFGIFRNPTKSPWPPWLQPRGPCRFLGGSWGVGRGWVGALRICRNLQESLSPRVDFPGGTTSRFQESRTRSRNPERLHEPPGRPRVPSRDPERARVRRREPRLCRFGTRGWNFRFSAKFHETAMAALASAEGALQVSGGFLGGGDFILLFFF